MLEIAIDIGGTSCDVALVREGKPLLSREGRIARYPLRVPMVDVSTVGAGGGSLAWLDRSGGLHVGPQSAGAEPGPACYGRGGIVPTVTDASVVLGYLNPHYFAGGDLTLQVDKAYQVVRDTAARLHMPPAVEFVNLRSVHSAPLPHPQLTVPAPSSSLEAARKGMRPVYFDEYQAYRDTPVYQCDLLPLGAQFDGPAIVEQPDTTTVVYPGLTCRGDDAGNLLLTLYTC